MNKRFASVVGILLGLGAHDTSAIRGMPLTVAEEERSSADRRVHVRLTVAPTLPAMAREALTREAAAIWRP